MRRARSRQLGDRLGQAGDRQAAIILDERAARGGELRAARGRRSSTSGVERAQLARERAGVQIAGRLAARQQEAQAQEPGRLNSDGIDQRVDRERR